MDIEIVAGGALQSASSQGNSAIEILTQTGGDPDALPTAEGTVTYAIPTVTGVYTGALPSGTGDVFITLTHGRSGASTVVRNLGLSAWVWVFCALHWMGLLRM